MTFTMLFSNLLNWCRNHLIFTKADLLNCCRNHLIFTKAVLFLSGLVLSYSLAYYAVVSVLIDYLSELSDITLRQSAMAINLLDGITAVFAVILTHVSETSTGRFKIICVCAAAYVVGLALLILASECIGMFYLGTVLLAIGQSGKEPTLNAFFEDQLKHKNVISGSTEKNQESDQTNRANGQDEEKQYNIWWHTAKLVGAVIAIFGLGSSSWITTLTVSAILMGGTSLLFLLGCKCYNYEKPTGSPLGTIYRVFKAGFLRFNLKYPDSEEGYYWKNQRQDENCVYKNKRGQLQLLPHVPILFRWLNKAAIISEAEPKFPNPGRFLETSEKFGNICTVKEVREVMQLSRLLHLLLIFSAYSLVVAADNTFFVEQSSNLNPYINNGFIIKVSFMFLLKSLISTLVMFVFWWRGWTKQSITVWRIGAGMIAAVLCCITARQVELKRLHLIDEENIEGHDTETTISMSILALIPQYLLSGLMEGLAREGLAQFFYNHVPESMRTFSGPFDELVLGIGKFFSIPFVLIFKSWFGNTINDSHLDRFYLVLAILCFVLLCIYVYYSIKYGYLDDYTEEENEEPNNPEQTSEEVDNQIDQEESADVICHEEALMEPFSQ
ncbi:Protein NRT1/ PTR FAMILY 5.7 [Quillaja saponaria]|nr:Protein NRT1/ PTR FAMILY 5.7 [Quillaja saponaria]